MIADTSNTQEFSLLYLNSWLMWNIYHSYTLEILHHLSTAGLFYILATWVSNWVVNNGTFLYIIPIALYEVTGDPEDKNETIAQW